MKIVSAFSTHPGKRAEVAGKLNEDYAHSWIKDKVHYQIVADGNGADENLSPAAFAVNEIQRFTDIYSEENMSCSELKTMLKGAVYCANRVLLAFKRANGERYGKNCFASADIIAIREDGAFLSLHTGDSRTYLLRNEKLHLITKDQTEAQRLCDEGKISRSQIFTHPDRDTLVSVLGIDNPKIDVKEGHLKEGDIVILLSDGAHKVLSPDEIRSIVLSAGNCNDTCKGITDGANMRGGPDNISVCVSFVPN